MKVLLIAEQANPEWVSVPLVGWSLSVAIAQITEAHIVTQIRNRGAFLRQGMVENENFTAIDNEYVAARASKIARIIRGGEGKGWTAVTALSTLSYYAFEWELWRRFGERINRGEFDIVHRITPLSPTAPSLLAKRCAGANVPFVLGPLNGGLSWPAGFAHRRKAENEWLSQIRWLYRLLPGYKTTLKYSRSILVGSNATRSKIPAKYQDKVSYLPENGVDSSRFAKVRTKTAGSPLSGVFVGRLVSYKCPDILLKASAGLLRDGRLKLRFVGSGPMLEELKSLVAALNVNHAVEFLGWMDHRDIQDVLIASDFLALPSIREFGGGVVLEAMACGLPPIVANYGGPAELVEPDTGFRVDFHDEESLISNMGKALSAIAAEPQILDQMSDRAVRRVRTAFTWEAKARAILSIYRHASDESPRVPRRLP